MKTQVWVYIAVVVLSIGAGVAIAGLPDSVEQEPTIQPPATTEAPAPTDPPTTEPAVTEPPATDPPDTEPPATEPETTDAPTTDPAESTTTTAESSTTTVESTTTTLPLPERSEFDVAVVNAASVGGAASNVSGALEELGYVDVGSFDGPEIVDVTIIYAAEGFQAPADRLAEEDMGMEPGLVFPIDAAPDIEGLDEADMIVYLGRDVVDLPIFG